MLRASLAFVLCLALTACAPPSPLPTAPLPSPAGSVAPPQPAPATDSDSPARVLPGRRSLVEPSPAAQIPAAAITLYPYNRLTDAWYAPNGDLWLIGGFGILRQKADGEQTWYSMQNGLPANYFQAIAVSPQGEIWVGGAENTLLRFDGNAWRDETAALLSLPQDSPWWTCRTRNIFGIDFDSGGQIWVANGGIHLYTRENGRWKDAGFPTELLPIAGGGGCPLGLRVRNAQDITIFRQGCCAMPPSAYRFDGRAWTQDPKPQDFQEYLAARRNGPELRLNRADLRVSGFPWPFPPERFLPPLLNPIWPAGDSLRPHRFGEMGLAFDEHGALWLNDHQSLYHNRNGTFQEEPNLLLGGAFDPDFNTLRWLDFPGNPLMRAADGRAMEFGRWFWLQTELGYRYGPRMSEQASEWNDPWLYFHRDARGSVWFYLPGEGLIRNQNGEMTVFPGPADLTLPALGGLHVLEDGRVLVGTTGAVWVFARGNWQKWILPDTMAVFWRFAQDARGALYAATDTDVYRITPEGYTRWQFPAAPHALPPRALLLAALPENRIVYVNSHILAQWNGAAWQSYRFERVTLSAAALEAAGRLWAYAGYDGLLRFDLMQMFP